ncbi:MAG: peptidoglycan LD-endopeptidase LytH [Blastocatellia bacterium]|jgi:murein DD-endopeptidase MepM/ murein hydrolase activator NlpD|nr:peptidoglycan LD-endopeptidase LytH [Blastocatellia bacterium]
MKLPQSPRTRILIAFVAAVFAIAALVLWLSSKTRDGRKHILTWARFSDATPAPTAIPVISSAAPAATPSAAPSVSASPINTPSPQPLPPSQANLIVPVLGVKPDQLRDTFADARSEGRVHDAIDIAAPHGTPVIAAADGPVVKLFPSERGGTTIYQLSTDGRYVYYYAHLDRYAEGLAVGHFAKQGETIAYVGDTGNAGAGNYHLHFSIALIADPKRYWEGTNVNPYPLLRH